MGARRVKFFHFHAVIGKEIDQIIAFYIHLWSWRPLLGENAGSTTDWTSRQAQFSHVIRLPTYHMNRTALPPCEADALIFLFTDTVLFSKNCYFIQVRIQDLVKGGGPASEAESCRHSKVESRKRSEHSAARVQGPLKGPGSFWVFDAQICIFTHSRDFFSYF